MVVRAVEALPARARLVRLPTRGSAEAPGLRRVWERSGGDVPGDEDGDARGDTRTLRVEPAEGCMLTAEAAARAMSALERGYARDGEGDGDGATSLGRRLGGGGGDFGVAGHGEDTGGARSRDARRDGETHGRKATAHRRRRTRPPENQSRVREERNRRRARPPVCRFSRVSQVYRAREGGWLHDSSFRVVCAPASHPRRAICPRIASAICGAS